VFLAANTVSQLKGKAVKIDKTGKISDKARGNSEAHGYKKCRAHKVTLKKECLEYNSVECCHK
jgi:hypothetical protein